jgi:hypothetical protein
MKRSDIDQKWPNALRWFLAQNLNSCTPWHLIQKPAECQFAANAFQREDLQKREVFAFARRQDCDDFAGLLILDGKITDKVIYFHPVFAGAATNELSSNTWNIVCDEYEDVFEFFANRVVPDMKDWALVEDASNL